jgi:hypothetical protein
MYIEALTRELKKCEKSPKIVIICSIEPWDWCYDFFNSFAEKFSVNIGVFCSNNWLFLQNFYHNIGLWEKRQIFAENWQKSQKIVIICSIEPWTQWLYRFRDEKMAPKLCVTRACRLWRQRWHGGKKIGSQCCKRGRLAFVAWCTFKHWRKQFTNLQYS